MAEEREGFDLIAFFGLDAFLVAYFILATYQTPMWGTTLAFTVMLLASAVALLAVRGYAPSLDEEPEVADFDEPLTGYSLLVGFLVGLGLLALAGLISRVSQLFQGLSILWVPKPDIAVFALGPLNPQLLGNIIYQFALVAPAEETLKIAGIYAIYSRLPAETPLRETVSVSIPVAFWSIFHLILGGYSPWMLVTAFLAGVIIYLFALKATGNLLTAILAHATYNSAVLLLASI